MPRYERLGITGEIEDFYGLLLKNKVKSSSGMKAQTRNGNPSLLSKYEA